MKKKVWVFLAVVLAGGLASFFLLRDGAISFDRYKWWSKEKEKQTVRIAVVLTGGSYDQAVRGLKEELQKKGYIENKDIYYDIFDTQGNSLIKDDVAEKIRKSNPDYFYTVSTPITSEIKKIFKDEKPIVFNIVGDPVGGGFIKDYAFPGSNLTGCSNLSAELSGKRLEIFKKAFPQITRVATFYNPENKFSALSIEITKKAAATLGIELAEFKVKDKEELAASLASIQPDQFQGIYITPDAMVVSNVELILQKSSELKIPTMGHEETLAEKGVSISYGANFYRLGSQCASVFTELFAGQNPGEIPVRTPDRLDITINAKNFDSFGINISPDVLNLADRVIR